MTVNSKLVCHAVLAISVLLIPASLVAKEPASSGQLSNIVITTNWGEDTCSLVDVQKGLELAKIQVGLKPYDVKVDSKGRYAFVTCSGEDYLSTIDIQAMLEMEDRRVTVGASPRDIAITADDSRAVVASAGTDSIAVVDLVKNELLYTVEVGAIPYGVALTADGSTAAITCWGENTLVFVRLGDDGGQVIKKLEVGSLPYTAVIDARDRFVLVSCFGSHKVYVADLASLELIGDGVDVGRSPWGLAISDTGKAVVANFYSADASILTIDYDANPPVKESVRIELAGPNEKGRRGKNASFSGDPNIVVLSDLAKNELLLVNIEDQTVTKTVPVGRAPYGIAWLPRPASEAIVAQATSK